MLKLLRLAAFLLATLPCAMPALAVHIERLVLIDACADRELRSLSGNALIDFSSDGDCLTLRADASPDTESVVFRVNGIAVRTENVSPYTIANDNRGDYFKWELTPGLYQVTATPHDDNQGAGRAGAAFAVSLEVVTETPVGAPTPQDPATPQVSDLVLVDACTDRDIGPLRDGDAVDTSLVGTCLNIRAETNSVTRSVRFGIGDNPNFRLENASPFSMAGDSGGNFADWDPPAGNYSVTATAFSDRVGAGIEGPTLRVNFAIGGDGSGSPQPPDPEPVPQPSPTPPSGGGSGVVTGELRTWHKITLDFEGPRVSEEDSRNPFRDYRLQVVFTHESGLTLEVPGYFAADGRAADTGAREGSVWRAHLAPPRSGRWSYRALFRTGSEIARSLDPNRGTALAPDGASGSFQVSPSNKSAPDFRGRGRIEYTGNRYYRLQGSGEYFLKGGAGSPENLLAYADFDNTQDHAGGRSNDLPSGLHGYDPHVRDWRSGDPLWRGNKGKGLIGALNYLAAQGMNSVYFLTLNVNGDGREVYPWTSYGSRDRYDVSKLAQWERVFAHMDRLGLALHVVTQEQENDQLLDGGNLGLQRAVYYRELIARFGHHLGLFWNLGEENTNSTSQRKAFTNFIAVLDPYDHPIVAHTYANEKRLVYEPLLGHPGFTGPSLQSGPGPIHAETIEWIDRSRNALRPWVVSVDETGPANAGVVPDRVDPTHDEIRHKALWGHLMAGGAGVEWYFGYDFEHDDLSTEDFRSRANMWRQTAHALNFFRSHIPFHEMSHGDSLTTSSSDYVLARRGSVYAVYRPAGGRNELDLRGESGSYSVKWFNPRTGGGLQNGSVTQLAGGAWRDLGDPPRDSHRDWVARIVRAGDGPVDQPDDDPESTPTIPPPTPEPDTTGGIEVTALVLVNACSDRDVRPLAPADTVELDGCVSIRADTAGDARSVRFTVDGNALRTENAAPYAIGGDASGDYAPWSPGSGRKVLRAIPFDGRNATGFSGVPKEITVDFN